MKCVNYARVSTDRQGDKGLSIPAQLQAMRQHARDRGSEIKEEFVERGASARTAGRPALRAMLSKCREPDAGIGVVLVHQIDRLARNLADHLALKAVLKERGIALASSSSTQTRLTSRPARSDRLVWNTARRPHYYPGPVLEHEATKSVAAEATAVEYRRHRYCSLVRTSVRFAPRAVPISRPVIPAIRRRTVAAPLRSP